MEEEAVEEENFLSDEEEYHILCEVSDYAFSFLLFFWLV